MATPRPTRRQALRSAAGLGLLASLGGPARALVRGPRVLGADAASGDEAPVLVLLELNGGNDGLSTVVPYGDDAYGANRRATRIETDRLLTLDDYVGLHPNLKGLRATFEKGRLAVVQGCGYPRPNRSHFKSMEIWHAGDRRGRGVGEGWVGRLCNAAFGQEAQAGRVVHVGGAVPFALRSATHGAASFLVPEGYRWVDKEDQVAAYDDLERESRAGDRLAYLRGVLSDARASSRAIRSAAADYRPSVEYPDDPFGYDLMALAAVIQGGIGARVLSLKLGGFDTHSAQRGAHDTLMRRLDEGLSAFLADLKATAAGRNTVVVAFSEFGRRVAENGSRGTDHGAAGPMFVAGARVRGGLYGKHPSLTELDKGDLVHTTDFRRVYAAAIEACFGIGGEAVLGEGFAPLPLFA